MRLNTKYVFVGVSTSGVMIELHTQVSPDDKGEFFIVNWSKENALKLYKAEEDK